MQAGPGYSVTLGGEYSIIQDTITISQPDDFRGDLNLIQSELSNLDSIGIVSVSPQSPIPDNFGQCTWDVTFESKAGNIPSIEVAKSGRNDFSSSAILNSNNKVTVTDDTVRGTSIPVSGDFRLDFDGEVTGYMPYNASPQEMKAALDALDNIGQVAVTRTGPDVNRCYTWDITFVSDLGPMPLISPDDLDLRGTVASMSVSKITVGALPPFDGPDYGSQLITDTVNDLSLVIPQLKQGIPYYVRISASSEVGYGPSIMPYPPVEVPYPLPPANPSHVQVESMDGSTLAVSIDAPFHDGDEVISTYRVDYNTQPFSREKQRISITCNPQPEIQSVSTMAADINEVQYLVIDSSYQGNGEVFEIQQVLCDATGGTFGLSFGDETAYISHNDGVEEIKEAIESLSMVDQVSVIINNGGSTACLSHDGVNAGDFSITFQSLFGIAGDLPLMTAETSGLDGARRVEILPVTDGDASLSGSLKLSFRGSTTNAIDVSSGSFKLASDIEAALEALDTIQQDGVLVTAVSLENGGSEKIFRIEFEGEGVGGNVEPLTVVPEYMLIKGSSADAFILSDGESYTARNGIDLVVSRVGNELNGHFRLTLRGHTTKSITFNSSVDEVKSRLEELPNIGKVDVRMSGPSKEMAYRWVITFLSNPGYFPPSSRDVDLLEAINELSTLVDDDTSADILIESIHDGDDRLKGEFLLSFNDGKTTETTRPLPSFISADDLKMELEALPNIGFVNVVRSQSLVGYEWDVEFVSCALKNEAEICNEGDLLDLVVSSINLQGCGGPTLAVVELNTGSGPGHCPHLPNGLCSDELPFDGNYPIKHNIRNLHLGTPYYVQARLRNSQSYGVQRLSIPSNAAPRHNPPGLPPPIVLKESSSSSITVSWSKPKENGGKAVSGYELWMDTWNGGDASMVYDGAGSPDVLEYRLTTDDMGPYSQVVETGRQYRFQVRAINNCDTNDPARACYGDFSEVQFFTVRDPRPPLPPSIPKRDAKTRVTSSNDASISISWAPPVDNGGSPITGYIVYVRDSTGAMTSHSLGSDTITWQEDGLSPGEVYRFHVIAINAIGKSGNSPVLTTLAAVAPGLNFIGEPRYSNLEYRPIITEVRETSLNTKWSHVPADMTGASPITGFKLYLYKDIKPLPRYDADPVLQEIQHIIVSSELAVSGTFTASFRGFETEDIAVHATPDEVKAALENLPSINCVHVDSLLKGWAVTFLSEAGDLPLMEVTSGRLLGDVNAKMIVNEATKGDSANLVYDGSDSPATLSFEALNLIPDIGYAFKVAPINSIGDGVLSAASIVTIARSGASPSRTTASGSALSRGIAGSIHEEQIVTFLSDDCNSDKLIMSFEFSESTDNLCGATHSEFESAIESLSGVGDVHVTREEHSIDGHIGHSWTVTFNSQIGDVPLLTVDKSQVGRGVDAYGVSGINAVFVTEFLKGQANEFIIEPKKASGTVVKDITTHAGMEGSDIFFTELWTSEPSIVDGSHIWYSDGGVGSYNRLLYEEQVIAIPNSIGSFYLAMDTSESQPKGRINGQYFKTETLFFKDVAEISLQDALSSLPNVGQVDVTKKNEEHESISYYTVTFKEIYGELPMISASDPSIIISRNGGQYSSTEVQSIAISADKPFVYEVQHITIDSTSCVELTVSFMGSSETNGIPCSFATESEITSSASLLEDELNALPDVKVRVDADSSFIEDGSNFSQFKVTFLEPVGPLPLLESNHGEISQVVQGESILSGSFVLSYEGEYTDDIPFDASAKYVKSTLESLDTITEVNVKRMDKYTGYQWAVSFTGNAGNLPLLIAHNNVFEVQSIQTSGGLPTPLGGTFLLSYLTETTPPLFHNSSAALLKSSLEALPSINRVDVSQQISENGQSRWLVTFRSPYNPASLKIDSANISGSLESATVSVHVDSKHPSLLVKSGSDPLIAVEERVAGRPSYTGQYIANTAGTYTLAVMQLESGGLNANYYDNQWLLDEVAVERIDPTIQFDWRSGIITQYGRDYISARWWGKVSPPTTELYTFYLVADDGAKLYIDHNLVIDSWDDNHAIEKRASVPLTAGVFHDVKVEYKEITGDAYIQLQWSTRSIEKQIIPPSQLYYTSHIVGSPFLTTVSPGAADYPYSTFVDDVIEGNRTVTIAGDRASFYLQAKDSTGNKKLTNGDAQGDAQSPEEQFTVEVIGSHGSVSGDVVYLKSGMYRVDYTVMKAGTYQVHVKTGGTDIYCGLGEKDKCSPFALTVLPGATLASNSEAESSFDPVDNLVESRAGDTGKIFLQAKDAFGNNRKLGGDIVSAKFQSSLNPDIQYRGNVLDRGDGSYAISYSIPLSGDYVVSITLNGKPVQYCTGPNGKRWDSRFYDGIRVYASPSFCSLNDSLILNVIHRYVHGMSSTLIEEDGLSGLSTAIVGVEAGFVIESRDKFGNLRIGSSTSNIAESGDGMSDAFLITFVSPSGFTTMTSSAIQILTCSDSSIAGYFRLSYGGLVSIDIPHDISATAMQMVLSSMHGEQTGVSSVEVKREFDGNGNYQWTVIFIDNLDLWSQYPLVVLPGSDGFSAVANTLTVQKAASSGRYPIKYTLWEKGTYELSVYSGSTLVTGSSYTVEVIANLPTASSSSAHGLGLQVGVAGEQSSFEVQVKDSRQSEIQTIISSGTVIDIVNEIQSLEIVSSRGNTFQLEFRGQQTSFFEVGGSTLQNIKDAFTALSTIGEVDVTSTGISIIETGDIINIEFLTERGELDLIRSTGPDIVTKLRVGETPYRAERQSIHCNADGGYVILSFGEKSITLDASDDMDSVKAKLSEITGSAISILEVDNSIQGFCNPFGKHFFVDFPVELGNVAAIEVNIDSLQNGSISIHGSGEGHQGAVNGISPIMGRFTMSHEGFSTHSIAVDASAADVKAALESLPTIGSVSVTKDVIGIRLDENGENLVPGTTSLFSVWSVTFAHENDGGCFPGSWDKCPSNIGDVMTLNIDASMISFEIGSTQQQASPNIKIYEVRKGTSGNFIHDPDEVEIDFSLTHDIAIDTGIGMAATYEVSCSYSPEAIAANDPSGSFVINVLDKKIVVTAQTTMAQLKNLLRSELELIDNISTVGSSYGTVCRFDSDNPVTAVTKLIFSKREKPLSDFFVDSTDNLIVSARNQVDMVDTVQHLGSGLFRVVYTPRISGLYSTSIKINDKYIWVDLSSGVLVEPTYASAHLSTHDSNVIAIAGTKQIFHVVSRDRFENWVSPISSNETTILVSLSGYSDPCNRHQNLTERLGATIQETNMGSSNGHYEISYVPSLAGYYEASVMMRAQGGLLATYYKNQDLSQPVYGNFHYSKQKEYGMAWCFDSKVACDSTLLDRNISFSWGFDSPLPSDPSFPADAFSIMWTGEVKPVKSDEYTFTIKLNGGVRLAVGAHVIIDDLSGVNADSVSSNPIVLLKNEFYPIKLEYSHLVDEASIELFWESSSMGKQLVPSSALYFTRHIKGSPFSIQVVPASIAPTSVAQGGGLDECIALQECSFVVYTKDENNNSRFNDGSDPNFEISMVGIGGWAREGRINSVVDSESPIAVSQLRSESNDWQYIGQVDVVHQSLSVSSNNVNVLGILKRGDNVVIDGVMNTVSSSGSFGERIIPLLNPYQGETKSNIPMYKASKMCLSGTHTIKYTPDVRGSYAMDVKLPKIAEVQRITSFVLNGSSLSGSFTLKYGAMSSDAIQFDASAEDLKTTIESMSGIGDVTVSVYSCVNPSVSCSWDITFDTYIGDVFTPLVNLDQLMGIGANVQIMELTKGKASASIIGFPRTIEVYPGETSPLWSTAYGTGLVMATAGENATFTIQAKDLFGNDRMTSQDADLFAVHVIPENCDSSHSIIEGTVTQTSNGAYKVEFTPYTSGYHTISVVMSTSEEKQMITTGYNTKVRGGTFTILLNKKPSLPIPWDGDEDEIAAFLNASFGTTSTFDVEKHSHGLFNYKYIISFKTFVGDAPLFEVDTSNIIGNANAWKATSVKDGKFSHIKLLDPEHETQRITVSVEDDSSVDRATFSLTFMGRKTEPISWDASADILRSKLEKLATVGDILVSSEVDLITNSRHWLVTFDPYEGRSPKSTYNFGNLPSLEVSDSHASITVTIATVQNGHSPFRVMVSPAGPSTHSTLAYDLSNGTYNTLNKFYLQARDNHLNTVVSGPLNEVQIIETSAHSNLGGRFEVSVLGYTLRFEATAFLSEIEMGLQSVPGIGSVTVTSNSVKDEVLGKTGHVTKGLSTLTPSHELNEFIVGDWIRVGHQHDGQLFSIVAMSDVSPYTVTLSSPYTGDSNDFATLYQHGSRFNRKGYQYIVSFDSDLGDFPSLAVDGALLEGQDAAIKMTSCDWNLSQKLELFATGPDMVFGHFDLEYRGEKTRLLSVDLTADELSNAIKSDITSIHELFIADELDYSYGGKSWIIQLQSFDGEANLFFAESYLINGGYVVSTNYCPTLSQGEPLYSAASVAGRRGLDFAVELSGPATVQGKAEHQENGRYLLTYTSPRAGEYLLSVLGADFGGLTGEYFSDPSVQASPNTTRVDSVIDFRQTSANAMTSRSGNYVMIHWTGYAKPSFSEVYTFTVRLIGDVRLWIDNHLLIDKYDGTTKEGNEFKEFSARTAKALVANQLVSIKIEYQESHGNTTIQLLWNSISQPLTIIDSQKLYYNASHISGSPFVVSPLSVKPSAPTDCKLSVNAWDALNISWANPEDDGGDDVTKYLIETWDANMYGSTEKQQLRMKRTIIDGSMFISMNEHMTKSLPIDVSADELEKALESLPNVGDLLVSKTIESDFVVFEIEFLTDNAPVPVLNVDLVSVIPHAESNEYCICAKENTECQGGLAHLSCDITSSRKGSVFTKSTELIAPSEEASNYEASFWHLINGLEQSSSIEEGFGVRVSAGNVNGFGVPCQSQFLKPSGPPLPPEVVEIKRTAFSHTSLMVHFTSVSFPEDKASVVTGFYIEWSLNEDFLPGTVSNTTVAIESVRSERLSAYNNVGKEFNAYLIEDLTPGLHYFIRIASINSAGTGPSSYSTPLSLAPGLKPSDPENGVTLQALDAVNSSASVLELCSSLHVSWRAPINSNGFDVKSHFVEYWVSDGVNEVQALTLSSPTQSKAIGTFTLEYGRDTTDSLSIDASAEDVKISLENLSTIRSVKVWRSGENPNYTWTVTFLSEFPSVYGTTLKIVENLTQLLNADGAVPTIEVSVLMPGLLPIGYKTKTIEVDNPLTTYYTLILEDLTPGQPYHVQVSVSNELGYGRPRPSVPSMLAPPIEKPSAPTNVILRVVSKQTLQVIFSKPESDGGDEITLYKIEWDTMPDFGSNNSGPTGSYSFVSPKDEIGCDPCTYQITGLSAGVDYYVRTYAYNSRGYSMDHGIPTPLFLSPKSAPDPPVNVNIWPKSDTEIIVTFPPSADDGGAPVTKYKIEWDAMGYQVGAPSTNDNNAMLYSEHNVQSITMTAENDDIEGTFRLSFGNHATEEISVKSSAYDIKLAIESLPTIGSTVVTRKALTNGVVWSITFLTNVGDDDYYGPIPLLGVSIDPTDLPHSFVTDTLGVPSTTLLGTGSRISIREEIAAFKGFEQQLVTAQCASNEGILGGYFTISIDGSRTNSMSSDISASGMKDELEKLHSIGTIKVLRQKILNRINSFRWRVIFIEHLGNSPLLEVQDHLSCTDGSGRPLVYNTEAVQGILPRMNGPYSGFVEIDAGDHLLGDPFVYSVNGLLPGMPYHFEVSAWNGAGGMYGSTQYSTPATVTSMDNPDPPTFVELSSIDDTRLEVRWNNLLNKGGVHQIRKYNVEVAESLSADSHDASFDNNSETYVGSFDVECTPEIQAIVLESDADDAAGYFTVHFMGVASAKIYVDYREAEIKDALEGMSTIDAVDVTIDPFSRGIGSTVSYGKRYLITILSPQGDLPSVLVSTGVAPPSTIATLGSLQGSSPIVRVESVADGVLPSKFITPPVLDKSKMYTSRVQAFNGFSWGDTSTSRRAISPSKTNPSPPRDVRVNVLSTNEIGVTWLAPEWDGGDSVNYKVQWDTDSKFDGSSATVTGHRHHFVIEDLDASESYFVRVIAFNSVGFSEPVLAKKSLSNQHEIEISLTESTGSVTYNETFQIEYNGRATEDLSVLSTTSDVANAISSLGISGAISVDREDHSTIFDSSSIETSYFSILYRITVYGNNGDEDVAMTINGDHLGDILALLQATNG